jgi:type IV pilus assembly protein PilB
MRKRLGEILLEAGIITNEQLTEALEYQRMWGHKLGTALVAKGFITEDVLLRVLGSTLKLPIVDIARIRVAPDVVKIVPARLAEKYDLIPIAVETQGGRQTLIVAMSDPLNLEAIDELKFTTGYNIRPVLSTISGVTDAMRKYYGRTSGWGKFGGDTRDDIMTVVHKGGEERTIDLTDDNSVQDVVVQGGDPRPEPTRSEDTIGPNTANASAKDEIRALVRLMIKKGYFSKEEFLRELQDILLY